MASENQSSAPEPDNKAMAELKSVENAPASSDAVVDNELNASLIFMIGAIASLIIAIVIVLLYALYQRELDRELERKVVAQQPQALTSVQAAQEVQLYTYGWLDREAGIVSIPIDRAMALTIKELNREPETPIELDTITEPDITTESETTAKPVGEDPGDGGS